MVHALLVIHLIVTLLLIGVILVQKSSSGAWGSGASVSSGVMTARGTQNFFTKTTSILAGIFLFLSLGLAVLSKTDGGARSSIVDDIAVQPAKIAPLVPAVPSVPVAK